ncbi:MAG: hypothetical protein V4677_18510 [Bacteroidota bacterium]
MKRKTRVRDAPKGCNERKSCRTLSGVECGKSPDSFRGKRAARIRQPAEHALKYKIDINYYQNRSNQIYLKNIPSLNALFSTSLELTAQELL